MEDRKLAEWLTVLDDEDTQFLKRFLLASGSLKALAEQYGVSYPTVRGRLDRLIAKVTEADRHKDADPFERTIRVMVADARIDASVGRELLSAYRNGKKSKG